MRTGKRLIGSIYNKYLGTVILSELAFSVCTVIDGILSGRYLGAGALAAIGLCTPFPSIIAVFSGVMSAGCQAKCSYYMGRGEKENANSVFSTVVLVSMVFSAIITFSFIAFADPIARGFGASGEAAELLGDTKDYLVSCATGTVGMIMYTVLCPIVQLEGKRKHIQISALVLTGLNITGDLANMFVFHGGLFGVGLVTALSNMAACGVLAAALLAKNVSFTFSFRLIRLSVLPGLLYKGSPQAVRRGTNALRPLFMNRLTMAAAGSAGLAALSVQGNLRAFSGTVGAGIAGTMLMIAGVIYAEKDFDSLRVLFRESVRKICVLVVPASALLVIAAPLIVRLYMPEHSEASEMAVKALRSYSLALPFVAFNEMYMNYFQATGRTNTSSVFSVLSRIGMIIPCGLILKALFGADGVWAAIFASEALVSLCIAAYALISGRTGSFAEKFLFISKSSFENTVFFDAVISQKGEQRGLSEKVEIFCEENGVDENRTYLTSLFCEELVTNIVEYGFEDDKPHSIDLRISITGEEIRIRIRDDCRPFDPGKWYQLYLTDDPIANIGIKIVIKSSRNFEYTTTFSLNNVFIVL